MPLTRTCNRSTEESTIADGAAGRGFLAQDMPGFDRLAEFDVDAAMLDRAVKRETEFKMRREPFGLDRIAGAVQIVEHVVEILLARNAGA